MSLRTLRSLVASIRFIFHLWTGHNRAIIIFAAACTAKLRTILASSHVHTAMVSAWREASTWLVGRDVVMPDHVHFFCAPNGADNPSLERWMRYWKSIVTKGIGAKSPDEWPYQGELNILQW